MKTYNSSNFFKHTFCEFQQVDDFVFPENGNYKSKSKSQYYYTKEGVYRKSNHWGRVANCRWRLSSNENYKNQKTVIAFANWRDFLPINSTEKFFFIEVDYDKKSAKLKHKKGNSKQHFFTYAESQKRVKQIHHLFKDDKWATYFDMNIDELRIKIISTYINSNTSLQEIKKRYR